MQISNKLFPFPVLTINTDDYENAKYKANLKVEKGINELVIKVDAKLNVKEIEDLIYKNQAEYILHIESSSSCYREIKTSMSSKFEVKIRNCYLGNSVEICVFIVAKKDIENYTSEKLNEDFNGENIKYEKGNIIAILEQATIKLEKEVNNLGVSDSIFSIIKLDSKNNEGMNVDIDNEKIQIQLPKEDFEKYLLLSENTDEWLPVFHSMFIMPTLVYALEQVKEDEEAYNQLKWYRVINKTLKNNDLELSREYIERETSFKIAQKILELPVKRAINKMTDFANNGEE